MPRMVQCVKLGRFLPGLPAAPVAGELGKRIYENVSAEAYAMWPTQATLLINHYGLNMADPEARKLLRQEMEEFFFGKEAQMPEGWEPAGAKGGAKGGAAAPRK